MPYGMSNYDWMIWQKNHPGEAHPDYSTSGYTDYNNPVARDAWQNDTPDPEGRFAILYEQQLEEDRDNPEAAARRKAKEELDRQKAEQRQKEIDAMQYFRDQSAAAQNRSVAGGQVAQDREAFQQGMNGDNAQSLGLLRDASEGKGPSLAGIQQQQGLNASIRAGMGGAANAGPSQFARSNGMLGGATQAGQFATQAVQQGGIGRAQEMAQARGAYGQATDARASQYQGLRNQEIDMAMKQREQNDKAALAWYGLNQQTDQAHRANDFQEQLLQAAARQNANVAALNQMSQGIGAAGGLADAGFKLAGALNDSPDKTSKKDDEDTYSDARLKGDVQMRNGHLLTQWRTR